MNKKKILIVSRSFYPENSPRSIRTTELAKEFSRQGHHVTVITHRKENPHSRFESEQGVTILDLGQPSFREPEIKGSGLERLIRRASRRIPLLLFEYPNIELTWMVRNALRKQSGYDLLISIAVPYPVHWGVAWARSNSHPIADVWVADCGDPYYGQENDSFRKPFYFKYVEKWFSRKADYITVPFEGAKTAYFEEFHSKIKVIPQGLSVPEVNGNSTSLENDVPTFAYFGNIASYLHYAIPLLHRLNEIEKDFKFIIYTRMENLFLEHLDDRTLKKCKINDYTDRITLFNELKEVDFLLHFPYENPSQRSLKLIDYAFMEKPVLSYKNSPFSIEALHEFIDGNYSKKLEMENPDQFRIENVCMKFLELL